MAWGDLRGVAGASLPAWVHFPWAVGLPNARSDVEAEEQVERLAVALRRGRAFHAAHQAERIRQGGDTFELGFYGGKQQLLDRTKVSQGAVGVGVAVPRWDTPPWRWRSPFLPPQVSVDRLPAWTQFEPFYERLAATKEQAGNLREEWQIGNGKIVVRVLTELVRLFLRSPPIPPAKAL